MSEITPPKKRRFWQLHLSTAVLLMFGAGCMFWVQLTEHKAFYYYGQEVYEPDVVQEMTAYGWPSPALYKFTGNAWHQDGRDYVQSPHDPFSWKTDDVATFVDLQFVISVLMTIAFISEYLIRRREGRKR